MPHTALLQNASEFIIAILVPAYKKSGFIPISAYKSTVHVKCPASGISIVCPTEVGLAPPILVGGKEEHL